MIVDDTQLIYTYLNGYLSEKEILLFEQRMQDPAFCDEFVKFVEDEELIQRAMSEIKIPRQPNKNIKKFIRKTVAFAAAAACIVFGYLYYEKNNFVATVSEFNGDITLNRGSKSLTLNKEIKIKNGDIIQTDQGLCSFTFKDGTTLEVKPGSVLKFDEDGGKFLTLDKGKIYTDVAPQKKNAEMTIKTPAGKVSVLGTQLSVNANKKRLVLEVFEGKVQIKNNTGSTSEVKAGEYAVAKDDFEIVPQKNPNMSEIQRKIERLKFSRWLDYSFELRKDKDLIAYYDFQLITDDTLENKSRATAKLPLNGKMSNCQKVLGRWHGKGGIYLDGKSFIDCGNNAAFNINGPMTVFVWFKANGFHRNQETLISKADNSWRLARFQETSGIEMAASGLSPSEWAVGKNSVDDNEWHLATGVYDGKEIKIYIDGVIDTSNNTSGKITINNARVLIGANSEYDNRNFRGWIDEAGIFNRALTPIEIRKMYERGEP